MEQQIRFCTARDGVRIAYASVGSGPVIVKAPNWLTHLEFEWQSPVWRHWWQELAQDHTVVRFDQRGTGLSDWDVGDISFEAWVSDLEAVVEAAGVDRFALLGISQGGAVAIEYAARHPERLSHLVLYGAFARGWLKRGQNRAEHEAVLTLMREGWGRDNPVYRQLFTGQFMPNATPEQMHWFNELQRVSCSPETAVRIRRVSSDMDVTDRLEAIRSPALVLHATDDLRVPFAEGRLLASRIPNARLVALDSANHLTVEDEPAWPVLVSAVREFLGDRMQPGAERPPIPNEAPMNLASSAGLTTREIEVLRLIAAGQSNQEIADTLVISVNTVTNHVKSILSKTGSANRTEAASYAFRSGLLG